MIYLSLLRATACLYGFITAVYKQTCHSEERRRSDVAISVSLSPAFANGFLYNSRCIIQEDDHSRYAPSS